MIDSHCHLNFPQLAGDLEGVIERARLAGVSHLINIGVGVDDSRRGAELAGRLDNVAATVGIHPCYDESARDATAELRDLAALPQVVAIGECGLDYFHDDVPRDVQRASFVRQLDLAAEVGLPVVIHSRESIADCAAIVKDYPEIQAVFHCFTAGPAEAELLAEAGHYVGFTGPLTFKKNDALREAAALLPAERAARRDRRAVPLARAQTRRPPVRAGLRGPHVEETRLGPRLVDPGGRPHHDRELPPAVQMASLGACVLAGELAC